MPRVSLILEDLPDGSLKLSLHSDPPLQQPFTDAQLFAISTHAFLINEIGAPISVIEPVDLVDHYQVAAIPS